MEQRICHKGSSICWANAAVDTLAWAMGGAGKPGKALPGQFIWAGIVRESFSIS